MADTRNEADVLIVGAGLSGVMAARTLEAAGKKVIVLDKGRSVGGRMATRRIGGGHADHGAQFFTARDERFQKMIDEWIEQDIAFLWSHGFSSGSLGDQTVEGHPRYAIFGGMNVLVKHLAKDLNDVRVDRQATTVSLREKEWFITDRAGREYKAKAVLLTSPVPQSLMLLDAGETDLNSVDREMLESITYLPCLSGMFVMDRFVRLPEPGAIQRLNAPISWMGNNQQKGISDVSVITVQASGNYSKQLWDSPDERVLNLLQTDLEVFIGHEAKVAERQLKRWKYSWANTRHERSFLIASDLPNLAFGGDGFGTPRVEGAILSGLEVGEALAALV